MTAATASLEPSVSTDRDEGYLSIHRMTRSYGDVKALDDVSIQVKKGEFLALLGPSGCGKTTLLRLIAGLLDPDSGTIVLDGRKIEKLPAHRRDVGLVFQHYALFPHMSVSQNVRFGLEMRRIPRPEADQRVKEALALVGLGDLGRRRPAELSGGQQQRVALARAITIRPRLLLLDEPLSNLDAVLRTRVRTELRELHERTGLTTVMVTHDQAEAMTLADRIAVMAEGQVLQHDTPRAIYEKPARSFVSTFVGTPPASALAIDKRLDGAVLVGGAPWQPAAPLSAALAGIKRMSMQLALRPEILTLVPAGTAGSLSGRVRAIEYLGADCLVHVVVADQTIVARVGAGTAVPSGAIGVAVEGVPPIFDLEDGHRLDPASQTGR